MESTSKPDLFQSLKDDKEIEEKPKMPNLGIEEKIDEKESFLDSADDNKDSGDDLDFMKGECSTQNNDRKRKLDKQTRKEIEEEEREKMLYVKETTETSTNI